MISPVSTCFLLLLQAYWDSLLDDLQLEEPCFIRVLTVFRDVKTTLLEQCWVPALQTSIHAAIDLDSLMNQIEDGFFGWEECVAMVGGVIFIILQLQAQKRDAGLNKGWAEIQYHLEAATQCSNNNQYRWRVLCKALEFLIDQTHMLSVDASNARWVFVCVCAVVQVLFVALAYYHPCAAV